MVYVVLALRVPVIFIEATEQVHRISAASEVCFVLTERNVFGGGGGGRGAG